MKHLKNFILSLVNSKNERLVYLEQANDAGNNLPPKEIRHKLPIEEIEGLLIKADRIPKGHPKKAEIVEIIQRIREAEGRVKNETLRELRKILDSLSVAKKPTKKPTDKPEFDKLQWEDEEGDSKEPSKKPEFDKLPWENEGGDPEEPTEKPKFDKLPLEDEEDSLDVK